MYRLFNVKIRERCLEKRFVRCALDSHLLFLSCRVNKFLFINTHWAFEKNERCGKGLALSGAMFLASGGKPLWRCAKRATIRRRTHTSDGYSRRGLASLVPSTLWESSPTFAVDGDRVLPIDTPANFYESLKAGFLVL